MAARRIAAYGSWPSPITAARVAAASIAFSDLRVDGAALYWIERRPSEQGRNAIVCADRSGAVRDVLAPPFSARTRVHEYGGGDFGVAAGMVCFANGDDQRVYLQHGGGRPVAITQPRERRYADFVIDGPRQRIICVCEDHGGGREPINTLIAIPLDGAAAPRMLAGGADFYSSPALSADGRWLAWLAWNHPNMPWDGTELWVAALDHSGALQQARRIAGGVDESIVQPRWSPDGQLHFISDRSGWWNLYRRNGDDVAPLCPRAVDFGRPQWVLGMSSYDFLSANRIACSYVEDGAWRPAVLDTTDGSLATLSTALSDVADVRALGTHTAVMRAATPSQPWAVVTLDTDSGRIDVVRRAAELPLDEAFLLAPAHIGFDGGARAYAFLYRPAHPDYDGPAGERPPLIVRCHGGPTSAASSAFDPRVRFWTSRGFAFIDVNYRGSSGYGRAYRRALDEQWGVVDVDDCVAAARHCTEHSVADAARVIITGGSAGGFTVLCALAFRDVFAAGASYYGIGDLDALRRETHKFEAHYEERLVGPYPQSRQRYRERSPLYAAERISRPVIFFQGTDDAVVPPNQSERMVEALRRNGVPVAYLVFVGEAHGFRRAETIARALEAELCFYGRVLRFATDAVTPLPIDNLDTKPVPQ